MTSIIIDTFSAAVNIIFSEKFWLPENASWYDLHNPKPGVYYPTYKEFAKLPVYIAVLLFFRYLMENLIFRPLGRAVGMKDCPPMHLANIPVLERAYRLEKRPNADKMQALATDASLSQRQVERWFRVRRNGDKSSRLIKFSESGWRFVFYTVAQLYGIYALRDKPWLVDQRLCWIGYPFQSLSDDIYWYYMLELSFYSSAAISIFMEVRRKDFWQMFIHHIATILLISFSWVTNFVRVGTLIFLVHDVADPWMELAKLMKYSRREAGSIAAFTVFTVLWIITRVYIFPTRLIYSVLFDCSAILKPFYSLYLFEVLLLLLMGLHVLWTILILKIPYRMFLTGMAVNDSRSDSEVETLSGEEDDSVTKNNNNTSNYVNGTKSTLHTKSE